MSTRLKDSRGFTLTELLITVSIIGVLAAVAVPSFSGMAVRHELGGASRDVLAMLRNVRMIAVKENTAVVVSFDSVGGTYTAFVDDGAGSADDDLNGIADDALNWTQEAGERVVAFGRMPLHVDITGANFSGNTVFRFDKTGFPFDTANALNGGTVTLTDSQGVVRTVSLTISGHASIQ